MSMDPAARLLIEAECASLGYRVMHCLDTHDIDSFLELFTEDVELNSDWGAFRGREQLRALFDRPRGDLILAHVITNIHFTNVEEDQADAISYNTSYHTTGLDGENPFVNARLFRMHDRYQRTGQGWRIRSRRTEMVFAPKDWVKESLDIIASQGDPVKPRP